MYRRDTFWKIRRAYLLVAVIFSFIYPLMQFGEWFQQQKPIQTFAAAINLNEIIIVPQQTTPTIFTTGNILLGIYVLVAFSLVFKILLQVVSILIKSHRGERTEINGVSVIHLNENITPFSFFRNIFINKNQYSEREFPEILTHELSHVRQCHSYDVVLSEILTALCWFNPFAWLIKKEIKQNLEFLADNQVVKSGFEVKKYQYLLLNISCNYIDNQLINQFNISPIKKRITMMNKQKTSGKGLIKYSLIVPIVLIMLIVSNAQSVSAMLQKKHKNVSVSVRPIKTDAIKKNKVVVASKENSTNSKVFEMVEVPPVFQGGDNALMKFISKNVKYPADAIEKNIQGKVIIQFIVDETGKIIEPKIVKGVLPSIDAEALRVVKSMPNWTPGKEKGKNVKCKFFIPINFKLDGDSKILQKDQVYSISIFDGKEVSVDEFDKLIGKNERYFTVINPPTSVELFGEKAKNGAVVNSNRKADVAKYSDKIGTSRKM